MNDPNGNDRALTAALRAVAEDDARLRASLSVENSLRAEVRSIAARRRRTRTAVFAVAAAALIAAAIPAWRMAMHRADVPSTQPVSTVRADATTEVATAFLPLAYSSVPITNGQMVRLAVPRAALASFGLTSIDVVDSGTVMADVIVGEDGLARAVRFVRPARRAAQEQTR